MLKAYAVDFVENEIRGSKKSMQGRGRVHEQAASFRVAFMSTGGEISENVKGDLRQMNLVKGAYMV